MATGQKALLCYAPDTVFYTLNIGYGLAVTQNGGCILVLQNTPQEAHRYGLPYVTRPTFWTWPRAHLQGWSPVQPAWDQRAPIAVLAGTGEQKRLAVMRELSGVLTESGWTVEWSDGTRSLQEYVSLIQHAQLTATTSLTQEAFSVRRLSRWESRTSVTGRVWEGFAAGTCVVTNRASVLDQLGFSPGVHYLDLDRIFQQRDYLQGLSRAEIGAIAYGGQMHFHYLLGSKPKSAG